MLVLGLLEIQSYEMGNSSVYLLSVFITKGDNQEFVFQLWFYFIMQNFAPISHVILLECMIFTPLWITALQCFIVSGAKYLWDRVLKLQLLQNKWISS